MAIVAGSDVEYRSARDFRLQCFGEGRSVLTPTIELWTPSNLAAASERLLARDDKAGASYMERLEAQLGELPSPTALYQLIAEAMIFYYLFPSSTIIRTGTKIDRVRTVLSWARIKDSEEKPLSSFFGSGIGNVGTHYLNAQPYLLNFFLTFALEGKSRGINFNERVQCEEVADDIKSRTKHVVEARHALLHLLFPEYYESIASDGHKKKLVERYGSLAPDDDNIDSALVSIRKGLTENLGHEVHYYDPDFRKEWDVKAATSKVDSADLIPSSEQLLLPYLQLVGDGEEHEESELLEPLAASFSLSSVSRDRRLPSGSERVFDNRARWAKLHLRQARLVEISSDGYIRITARGKDLLNEDPTDLTRAALRRYPEYVEFEKRGEEGPSATLAPDAGNVWIEKTITENRPDRLTGDYAVGRAIWSPQRDGAGRDSYRFMRDVRPGDIILHLTDNRGFTGVSRAASAYEEFSGISGTQWGDRPCYLVRLEDYRQLTPPLLKETFFSPPYRERLLDVRKRERNLFYTEGVRIEGLRSLEGFYLTPAPAAPVAALNDAYTDLTGQQLVETPAGTSPLLASAAFSFEDLLQTTHWSEAGPVPWILSAWRRRIHQWAKNVPAPTRRTSGTKSSSSLARAGALTTWPLNFNSAGRPCETGSSRPTWTPAVAPTV